MSSAPVRVFDNRDVKSTLPVKRCNSEFCKDRNSYCNGVILWKWQCCQCRCKEDTLYKRYFDKCIEPIVSTAVSPKRTSTSRASTLASRKISPSLQSISSTTFSPVGHDFNLLKYLNLNNQALNK